MHGGAAGSGAPQGSRNGAFRHGLYTREHAAQRAELKALLATARAGLDEVG